VVNTPAIWLFFSKRTSVLPCQHYSSYVPYQRCIIIVIYNLVK
jgi:hypothetical protein